VGHHAHLALGALLAPPCAHHERVVDRYAPDLVDPFRAQRIGFADVAGNMLGGTGRGEGAGQAEDRDLAAPDLVGNLEGVGTERAAFALGLDELVEGGFGQGIAGLDRHGISSWSGGSEGPWCRCRLPLDSRPATISPRPLMDTPAPFRSPGFGRRAAGARRSRFRAPAKASPSVGLLAQEGRYVEALDAAVLERAHMVGRIAARAAPDGRLLVLVVAPRVADGAVRVV